MPDLEPPNPDRDGTLVGASQGVEQGWTYGNPEELDRVLEALRAGPPDEPPRFELEGPAPGEDDT